MSSSDQQQQQSQQDCGENEANDCCSTSVSVHSHLIKININNVVCSYSTKCHLNLRRIALLGLHVEYKKENSMVNMRLRKPHTTATIWSSGKITCAGAKSEAEAYRAARRYCRLLQKMKFKVTLCNYRVVNVLATCSMPFAVDIHQLARDYSSLCQYEPELHPGATFKLAQLKTSLKLFTTGNVTLTSANCELVRKAVEHIFPILERYRRDTPTPPAADVPATLSTDAPPPPTSTTTTTATTSETATSDVTHPSLAFNPISGNLIGCHAAAASLETPLSSTSANCYSHATYPDTTASSSSALSGPFDPVSAPQLHPPPLMLHHQHHDHSLPSLLADSTLTSPAASAVSNAATAVASSSASSTATLFAPHHNHHHTSPSHHHLHNTHQYLGGTGATSPNSSSNSSSSSSHHGMHHLHHVHHHLHHGHLLHVPNNHWFAGYDNHQQLLIDNVNVDEFLP